MPSDCGAAAADYARQLVALLPPGPAWNGFREGLGRRLLNALAEEPARIHNRACVLLTEVRPQSTDEMLAAREVEAGLPDACANDDFRTFQSRRAAPVAKWHGRGGQSPAFYIALAVLFGFEITITEFHPFIADGSDAGDPLTNDNWTHAWQVNATEETIFAFHASGNSAGDPLRWWGDEILECPIRRAKPAHTHVIFAYRS